ncbi:hypothetical protein ODZ83_03330 [Acaricomes phytoseiuli]|uniref:hypothetical protein n=1 Tax=Acaricomes phytoseiuli TaxID=291968 RepID=UPI00037853D2|nr:hypothetical protein [Acaricomes phytoseiuli]MCW1249231.1 hypothetical protein [Acaricomes phytoseiuli]
MAQLDIEGASFAEAAQRLGDLGTTSMYCPALPEAVLGNEAQVLSAWQGALESLTRIFATDGAAVREAGEVFTEVDQALAQSARSS